MSGAFFMVEGTEGDVNKTYCHTELRRSKYFAECFVAEAYNFHVLMPDIPAPVYQ